MSIVPKKRRARQRVRVHIPRTAEQFSALPVRSQDAWDRTMHVVTKMRNDGISLPKAAREYGVDPRTVQRLAASALRKRPNGRYAAKSKDSLLRILVLPTDNGKIEVPLRSSRTSSQVAEYWDAVALYRDTGDSSALRRFRGKSVIDAEGNAIPFVTDLNQIDRLASAGELHFESLYARAA